MEIEIKLDSNYKEPKIIVLTDRMSEEVNQLVKKLTDETPQMIAGFQEDQLRVLQQEELYRVFTRNGKVFASTDEGEFSLRLRLYE